MTFLFSDFWKNLAETAWFQLILAGVAGAFAASATFWYSKRLEMRREAYTAFETLFSEGRSIRNNYLNFIEYDLEFSRQQDFVNQSIGRKSKNATDMAGSAALAAQAAALSYKQQFEQSRVRFTGASFVLFALLMPRLKNTQFSEWVNSVTKITNRDIQHDKSFDVLKNDIDAELLPVITNLEHLGNRVLWELHAKWYERSLQNVRDWFSAQKDLIAMERGDKK